MAIIDTSKPKTQVFYTTTTQKAPEIRFTYWQNKSDTVGNPNTLAFETLYREVFAPWPLVHGDPKDWPGPAWSPCQFAGPRADENAGPINLLGLDYEAKEGAQANTLEDIATFWAVFRGFWHTTRRHTPEHPRARVIVALSRPIEPHEFEPFYKALLSLLGERGHVLDQTTFNPSRIWFLPGLASTSSKYLHGWFGGDQVIDVDAVLAMAPSLAPASKVRSKPTNSAKKTQLLSHHNAEGKPLPEHRARKYAQGALANLRDCVAVAPEGSRNQTLNNAAYQLFRYVGAGLLDGNAVENALAEAGAQVGLMPNETLATLNSTRAGETNPAWPHEHGDLVIDGPLPTRGFTKKREERRPANSNDWQLQLSRTERGALRNTMGNISLFLQHYYDLAFDEFASKILLLSPPPHDTGAPASYPRQWNDADDILAAIWLERNHRLNATRKAVADAVVCASRVNTIHPVRDYLNGLKHDGRPRLSSFLVDYFGAENTAFNREAGKRFMIAAVARIFEPGCKVDTILVLQSPQGYKKSTAFKELFDPWFTDELAEFGSRDAAVQCRGIWCAELAELSSISRGEVERIKAFASRSTDRYVQKYEKHASEHPRQCVFAGTTNSQAYLNDETGNRRFWPVAVRSIDLNALKADRDQLWAEAKAFYKADEPWWLIDPEVIAEQQAAAEAVREVDTWQDHIETYLNEQGNLEFIATTDLLKALGVDVVAKVSTADGRRLNRVMRALGFEPSQQKRDNKVRRGYRYSDARLSIVSWPGSRCFGEGICYLPPSATSKPRKL